MRIVHLTMAATRGGVLRVVETLAAAQANRHEVAVISGPTGRPPRWTQAVPWLEEQVRGNSDVPAILRLLVRLRAMAPSAVLIHACAPGELALLAALTARSRTTIVLEHAPQHHSPNKPMRNRLYALLNRRAAAWAAVSRAGARDLERSWKLPSGTVRALHLGVPEPAGPLSQEERRLVGDAGGSIILGLGAPCKTKGFDTFLRVSERLRATEPSVRSFWVGGDRLECRGVVQVVPWSSCVGGWLGVAEILLVPSRAEGLPLVVLEALAARTPVVASRIGGIPEAVEDGISGFLVAPEDLEGWCGAAERLLRNPELRRRFGSAGRRRWKAYFTVEAMVERVERLLSGSGGGSGTLER